MGGCKREPVTSPFLSLNVREARSDNISILASLKVGVIRPDRAS